MAVSLKRWLYLTHRWLGIALCLLLAMWFFSGVVMMYVGYPKLTDAERLSRLPPLAGGLLSPAAALSAAGLGGELRSLSLAASRGGEPVYQAQLADGRRVVVDARDGRLLARVDAGLALESARVHAGGEAAGARHLRTLDEDAFTHSRALDMHRPLHLVDLGDAHGTWLYVSGTSGEVVRDATRAERLWNYAGAWIHWLYPFRGNAFDAQWANIVNGLSIAGLLLTMTGAVVGILRWRFRRPYRSGRRTPYPGRMMRWHHVSGLLFAAITLTWLFSGLMSMGPWGFLRGAPARLDTAAMQGAPLRVEDLRRGPDAFLADGAVRELRWEPRLQRPTVIALDGSSAATLYDAASGETATLQERDVARAAAALLDAPLVRAELLAHYDLYYYSRAPHTMTGGRERPLPVLRLVYADPAATWVHVDPRTAEIVGRIDGNGRLRRWLFGMLHSWDWLPLLERRPLWDIALIALSLGGFALSVTGVVIGLRRLRPRRAQSRSRPRSA